MKARYHVLMSLTLAIPFAVAGSYWGSLMCILSGIFIDVDHQLDFYLLFGRFTLSMTELSEGLKEHNKPTFFCPLHSWEFIILLALLSYWHSMFIGTVVSVTAHLIADIIFNKREELDLLRFFFLYRARSELKLYEKFRRNYADKE